MNRKEEIDARIETLQEELENLKKQRERIEKPITERIKTFTDAVEELGSEHPLVKQYMAANGNEAFTRNTIAYMKLLIIAAALNEGWFPDLLNKDMRWYPWYSIIPRSENSWSRCSLAYAASYAAWPNSSADCSAILAVKSKEISDYFGNQFIDIWVEYLLGGYEIEKHDTDV